MTQISGPPLPVGDEAQRLAKRHLWLNFTRMSQFDTEEVPIIVRGEGCYVWDEAGKRYLDGLSGLYCVNVGHGREELQEAAAEQIRQLEYHPTWNFAHPPAIALAAKIAELAPGPLNRVLFTSGGSEAVDSAIKLARQYHRVNGEPTRTKVIARDVAYHGVTMGALAATGIQSCREPFEPLLPGGLHVPNTNAYRRWLDVSDEGLVDAIRERILFEGPDTIAAVIMEPVQNAGGCFTPPPGYFQAVRELCDEYGILLVSDEVICGWGRLGHWFGCQRYDFVPDMITSAKGLTSAYAPMGALIVADHVAEPFLHGDTTFMHGHTYSGHPVAAAVALANIDVMERDDLPGRVLRHEDDLRAALSSLLDIPIVGDVRGAGYFFALELVKDAATRETFDGAECEELLHEFLSPELQRRGLLCRADSRGDPVVQLSPPLIAGPEEFAEIVAILRPVLEEAAARL
jgi:adenosylmethionine-8-amino-7-oxononanoate aminotransferase